MATPTGSNRAAKRKASHATASRADLQEELKKATTTIAKVRAECDQFRRWWHEERVRHDKQEARIRHLEAALTAVGVLASEATGKLVAPEPYADIPF